MSFADDVAALTSAYVVEVRANLYEGEAPGAPSAEPLSWGSDLQGHTDLTPEMSERADGDPLVPIEYLLRLLTTDEGKLPNPDDDPDVAVWGVNVTTWVNAPWRPSDFATRERLVESKIATDDRFANVRAKFTRTGETLLLAIDGDLVAPDVAKPFKLTLHVTNADVLIKALEI